MNPIQYTAGSKDKWITAKIGIQGTRTSHNSLTALGHLDTVTCMTTCVSCLYEYISINQSIVFSIVHAYVNIIHAHPPINTYIHFISYISFLHLITELLVTIKSLDIARQLIPGKMPSIFRALPICFTFWSLYLQLYINVASEITYRYNDIIWITG